MNFLKFLLKYNVHTENAHISVQLNRFLQSEYNHITKYCILKQGDQHLRSLLYASFNQCFFIDVKQSAEKHN